MSVRVTWTRGGEARLVSIAADAVVLTSTVPWPPGSRIEGAVVVAGAAAGPLRVKVHASRRQAGSASPGGFAFLIEGRPIDLKRDLRVFLEDQLRKPERSEAAELPNPTPRPS
jgi:hypothetical protein